MVEMGEEMFKKLERIRTLSDCAVRLAQHHDTAASQMLASKMASELFALPLEEALPILRAFGHYLNLTSIAEMHHSVRTMRTEGVAVQSMDEVYTHLMERGLTPDELFAHVCRQHVEIVLTAHPTQVNRRTLQAKLTRIAQLLAEKEQDQTEEEREAGLADMMREITALWQTEELRRKKPTPLDGEFLNTTLL
jgi:phosphoenolpyruvate carboxylase